jgi:hypothetical protein
MRNFQQKGIQMISNRFKPYSKAIRRILISLTNNIMNPALKKVKVNLKKIDQYCNGRPIPTVTELNVFIQENELFDLQKYADSVMASVREREWLFYQNKINKSRV